VSASFHSPIGRAGLAADPSELGVHEAFEQERQPHEQDAWANAIAQALVEARPRLTLPEPAEPDGGAATPHSSGPTVKLPTLDGAEAGATQAGGEAAAAGTEPGPASPPLPNRLIAELSDSRLGRVELSVARGAHGLHIVINVADAHVKALIESEQALLLKSLQSCGLRVDSVRIGSELKSGTALAQPEVAQERVLARGRGNPNLRSGNVRGRGYGALPEEEPEDDTDRVDLTA
jgi:hypothetical protein